MMRGLILFTFSFFLTACGLQAPDVSIPKLGDLTGSVDASDVDCSNPQKWCDVRYSLRMTEENGMWVYWTAGERQIQENPNAEFMASSKWDVRMTRYFPVVGSNGGETVKDTKSEGNHAAFAALPEGVASIDPTRDQSIEFVEDNFASLDPSLRAGYQNPLLNAIGSGILKSYNMATHQVELSNKVFILRSSDSQSYYLMKFDIYLKTEKVFGFHWKFLGKK